MCRNWFVPAILMLALVGVAVGQDAKDKKEDSSTEAMGPPPRPEELNAYEPLIGKWQGELQFTENFPGGPGKGKGSSEIKWDLDRRVVRWEGQSTSDLGLYKYVTIMTYEPMEQTFLSYTFDNMGMVDIATVYPDASGKTWTMTSDGIDFATGAPAKNKTIMTLTDDDTLEWKWYVTPVSSPTPKLMMTGADKRQKK